MAIAVSRQPEVSGIMRWADGLISLGRGSAVDCVIVCTGGNAQFNFQLDNFCLKRKKAKNVQVVETAKYGNVLLPCHQIRQSRISFCLIAHVAGGWCVGGRAWFSMRRENGKCWRSGRRSKRRQKVGEFEVNSRQTRLCHSGLHDGAYILISSKNLATHTILLGKDARQEANHEADTRFLQA